MLGWSIAIYRLEDYKRVHAPEVWELILAKWSAGPGGLDWLKPLEEEGKTKAEGNGYPLWFDAKAVAILPLIADGPPAHKGPMVFGEDYVMPAGWTGRAKINQALIDECGPDEVLRVICWDQD
jgi:hypothetical protein